jgi:hypothetical protein
MTEEQKDIVLRGARYEIMNKYVDLSNAKDLSMHRAIAEAMQDYADLFHMAQLSKLHQPTVSICACGSKEYYVEQYKDVVKYYCKSCHEKISKH